MLKCDSLDGANQKIPEPHVYVVSRVVSEIPTFLPLTHSAQSQVTRVSAAVEMLVRTKLYQALIAKSLIA